MVNYKKLLLQTIGSIAIFVAGIIIGLNYSANEYQAKIATIQKSHAQDLAEQISLESELYQDSVAEQERREKAYQQTVQALNRRLYEKSQTLKLQLSELNRLEQSNEKIRNLGAMPTPDAVVEWLQ